MTRAGWMLVGVLVAAPLGAAGAQETPAGAGEERRRLEPVVVTATRIETPVAEVTAAVTVIPGEEIEARRYATVEDALRAVPGVEIQRSGPVGKLVTTRIRGASSGQIQVLIDGARVKSATAGVFDFSEISPDQIERIEVVRGPQSTLHGADAIGGVINIITKRGRGPLTASLAVEGGSLETHRERFTLSGARGPFDYALFGSLYETRGELDNDDSRQRAAGGRLGLRLPFGIALSLSGRYAKTRTDLPVDDVAPAGVTLDPDSQQQVESRTLTLALEQKPVAWWEHRLALHGYWSNLGFQDPFTPGTTDFGDTRSQINTVRREIEWVHALRLVPWNVLTVGAEYRHEEGAVRSVFAGFPTRFTERLVTRAAFVQDELRLWDRVILNGGVRYDDSSVFGREVTPRAGAAVVIKETGTKLRGGWGRGFRAPTINDLFFPDFGNPGLEPERSASWEVGADQALWQRRLRLQATYFHNRFEDLIQFVFAGGVFLPQNVARARTQGVEVGAELDALSWLVLHGSYTFTDTEDLDTGLPLRRFARHRWSVGATAEPIRALSLFVEAHVVSSQFDGPAAPRNDGHVRVDVGGTYRLSRRTGPWPGLDGYLRVENLLDERYAEVRGFRAPGLHAIVGLKATY
jgi:vitamin B12 transporter